MNSRSPRWQPRAALHRRLQAAVLILAQLLLGVDRVEATVGNASVSQLCDRAARTASEAHSVPYDVLRAISRAETGRGGGDGLHPWPWAVNMEGTGKWFNAEDDARAYVFKHFKRGARSFDVGCFQVNYKWHGTAFRSIDEMFDPLKNADYAARFLRSLFEEFGDWNTAAGAYHSRTPSFARSYAARFENIRRAMGPEREIAALPARAREAENTSGSRTGFMSGRPAPMFGQGSTRLGSLVPVSPERRENTTAFVRLN